MLGADEASRLGSEPVNARNTSLHQVLRRLFTVVDESAHPIFTKHDDVDHLIVSQQDQASVKLAIASARQRPCVTFACSDDELNRILEEAKRVEIRAFAVEYDVMKLEKLRARPRGIGELLLRTLTAADLREVREFAARADDASPFYAIFPFEHFLSRPSVGVWDGGRLVAILGIYLESATDVEIGRGYVLPSHRGRGLLREMAHELCVLLRERGFRQTVWGIMKTTNAASRKSLSALGFEGYGRIQVVELRR